MDAALAAEAEVISIIDQVNAETGVIDVDDPIYDGMSVEQLDERGLRRQWMSDDEGNLVSKIVLEADYVPMVSTSEWNADWSSLPRAVLEDPKFSGLDFRLECYENYGLAGATEAHSAGFMPIRMDKKMFNGTNFKVGSDGSVTMGDLTLTARPKEHTLVRAKQLAERNAKMLEDAAQASVDRGNSEIDPRYGKMEILNLSNEVQMRSSNPFQEPPSNPFEGMTREQIENQSRSRFEAAVRTGQQHDTKGKASFFFDKNPLGRDKVAERHDKNGKRDLLAEAMGAVGAR